MVFVKDFRKEFYDEIQHQRVLVLVSLDVDALCACKILQYLFQCDQVLYTIVAVTGRQELDKAYIENSEGVKYVIMINCGGNIDVIETLQPEDHVIFYICDSHRPVDVCNVYNQVQVKLLMKEDELEDLPEYTDVFRDEDSDDDDSGNDSDASDQAGKRRRFDEDALEKRRDKRLWTENRNKILFDYTQYCFYGTSAAYLMYEMAWKMSKDTNDLLWLGIVGVTEQYNNHKIDHDKYLEEIGQLQLHVSRLNHRKGEDSEQSISVDCLKITFDQELQLSLYRHWSLFDSICHSVYTACKFRVWTMKGKKKLHEFLAEIGLPLVQSKQKFAAMDVNLRTNIKEMIETYREKYQFDERSLYLPSFHAQYGYKNKMCATDVVLAAEAVLESIEKDVSASDSFLASLDILNRSNVTSLEKGIDMAKTQLMAIVNQVQSFIDMNQVISAGPFLYAFIQEGTPDIRFFSRPIGLQRLAKFTIEGYNSVTKSKKARFLPLVLGAPLDVEKGTTLIIGIPPVSDNSRKNFFGKAFESAANTTGARTLHDSFDSQVVEMKTDDRSKFFDALISILQ